MVLKVKKLISIFDVKTKQFLKEQEEESLFRELDMINRVV